MEMSVRELPVLANRDRGSAQSFRTNAGILQHIRPRPSPSTSFPLHESLTIAPYIFSTKGSVVK